METKTNVKGYKVTNPDATCLGQKYEVGQEYKVLGELVICKNGFHFCQNPNDCFNYYTFDSENRVFEVEALGEVIIDGDKSATSFIKFIRELTWMEVLALINTGKDNTGRANSGDSNSGNWNSGNWNSGDWNSGDRNSGYRNSGYSNSGYRNSGNSNSGDSNSGDRNSGAFCLDKEPTLYLFDKLSSMTVVDWEKSKVYRVMCNLLESSMWVYSENMTVEEKTKYPTHETTGGYLKTKTTYEMWADAWHNMDSETRSLFTSL